MIVAQITDFHISLPDGEPERLFGTSTHLRRAVAHLNSLESPPDVVLATGDLVHEGTLAEYRLLSELLAPLEAPVYLIPGNHDDREALRGAFADRSYVPAEGFIHYTVEDLPLRLIGLDTFIPDEIGGTLCEARLAWLAARLEEAPERPTVVFMHHPPCESGVGQMDAWKLRNSEAFGEVVVRHPQIERIVCGHLHRPVSWRWKGTLVSTCPSTAHQFGLDIGETPRPIRMVGEPPCCHLHVWRQGQGLVTHTSYIQPGKALV
jgi:3',5'-cyclic AMP phosphodiesterase CpdA